MNDVFRDETYEAFRAELKQAARSAMHEGVRTRRRRTVAVWAAALTLAGLTGSMWWRAANPGRPPVEWVRTTSQTELVATTAMSASDLIQSGNWPDLATIQTRKTETMSDEELLERFAGHPTLMLAVSSLEKRLIFLDPADQARFMVDELR